MNAHFKTFEDTMVVYGNNNNSEKDLGRDKYPQTAKEGFWVV